MKQIMQQSANLRSQQVSQMSQHSRLDKSDVPFNRPATPSISLSQLQHSQNQAA
jgi:hypothetical protein